MKNKDKAKKLNEILQSLDLSNVTNDLLIIQALYRFSEDIKDRKLKTKIIDFLEEVGKEYLERDFEEEAKVEFCCSDCHEYLPKDKESAVQNLCKDCFHEEELNQNEDDYYD